MYGLNPYGVSEFHMEYLELSKVFTPLKPRSLPYWKIGLALTSTQIALAAILKYLQPIRRNEQEEIQPSVPQDQAYGELTQAERSKTDQGRKQHIDTSILFRVTPSGSGECSRGYVRHVRVIQTLDTI
jgi:hypothetical protein